MIYRIYRFIGFKDDVSPQERSAIRQLSDNHSLIIKEADKGGNVVIWPVELYMAEAKRQLGNNILYVPLPADPTDCYKKKLDQILKTAKQYGIVTKSELDFLKVDRPAIPTFYMVPKIHKSLHNPLGRPIVSGIGGLCEKISTSVDFYLELFVLHFSHTHGIPCI